MQETKEENIEDASNSTESTESTESANSEDSNSTKVDFVNTSLTDDSPQSPRESTRSKIAITYVYAFFFTIACTFIIGLIKCFTSKEYIDMMLGVSGILSGPLGFIIGFYFKASDNK
jgi:hypothetical protein